MHGWPLQKVISGGQSGADQAGVSAAKFLNYQTGGRAPKGFQTEEGPAAWLAEFGLQASPSPSLRSRTYHNVVNSDGTVIFTGLVLAPKALKAAKAKYFEAPPTVDQALDLYGLQGGSRYTAALTLAHKKFMILNPTKGEELRAWIYESGIRTLNVAGTRESKAPGIFDWVYKFLSHALIPF